MYTSAFPVVYQITGDQSGSGFTIQHCEPETAREKCLKALKGMPDVQLSGCYGPTAVQTEVDRLDCDFCGQGKRKVGQARFVKLRRRRHFIAGIADGCARLQIAAPGVAFGTTRRVLAQDTVQFASVWVCPAER